MRCPKCGCADSKVIDSRTADKGQSIRRRRECLECKYRFTTYERRETQQLVVLKRDGSHEPFDGEKLKRGLIAATIKRDVALEKIDDLIHSIEIELQDQGKTEITSQDLGDLVLRKLLPIDKVAYVRFASVYRDFKDIDEFSHELRRLSY